MTMADKANYLENLIGLAQAEMNALAGLQRALSATLLPERQQATLGEVLVTLARASANLTEAIARTLESADDLVEVGRS